MGSLRMDTKSEKLTPKKLNYLSWGGIFYGIFFLAFGLSEWDNDTGVFLIIFGVLISAAGIFGVFHLKKRRANYMQDKMNNLLYELIRKNDGKISVLEFAIHANIEPKIAREFIETKAIQLGTVPDVDDNGTITYIFK